jgi:ribosomal protein S18 acetylase RimI-like enzyme
MVAGTANSPSVAEQALFMMLTLAKRASEMHSIVTGNKWAARLGALPYDLYGKTILIVGFGRIYVDGAVLPAVRGRGLGRRLLAWAEERAAALHRECHPGVAGALCVHVHEHNPSKRALVGAGYEAIRWEHRMTRALDGVLPEVAPTPPGLTLTRYTSDRDDAVRRAHSEAFADHWGAIPPDEQRWSHSYTGMRAFRPELSRVVLADDEVVAYLLAYFWEADAAATGVREAFVGQLGVRPPWRRRGLGGLLLAEALRAARAAGFERSVLTVDAANATGARGLYERAGFAVTDTSVTWTKPLG